MLPHRYFPGYLLRAGASLGRQGFCQAYICMGVLFYPDGHSRCYAPGLSLCRGYRLLEIGFWAFYGCFLMNAIGRRFRPICYVFFCGSDVLFASGEGCSRVLRARRISAALPCWRGVAACSASLLLGRLVARYAGQVFCNRRYWVFLLGSLFIVRRFLPAWRFPGRQTPLAGGPRR